MSAVRPIAALALGLVWACGGDYAGAVRMVLTEEAPALIAQATAQPLPPSRAAHDVPYYASHSAERKALLRSCRRDLSYDRDPDCMNAQMAETHIRARNTDVFARMDAEMSDPVWWAENGVGLRGYVEVCDSGAPTVTPARDCDAIRGGYALQQQRARNGR